MTRLEPLVVTALGRSPYDDELFTNENTEDPNVVRTGQQYDDRGRPYNPETQQRQRDHVRASNEVLQAAGIIEKAADFYARERPKTQPSRESDIRKAYTRRGYGQLALTCGVWGACGLRRRIELYKAYSEHPLLDLIRYERRRSGTLRLLGAGLPALMINRGFTSVAQWFDASDFSKTTKQVAGFAINWIMFHYKYYAILQQLGLISANQFVPKLLFMVPFSSESPFHSPPLPPDFSLRSIATYLHQFTIVIAPLAALHIWYKYSNTLIGTIYHHIYELLPHATNLGAASDREIKAQIAKLEEAQARLHASNLHGTQVDNLDEELLAEPLSPGASDISHETDSWDTEDSVYLSAAGRDSTLTDRSRSEGDPATLAALEGRAQPHGQARERERRSSAPSPPPHDSTPPPPQFYDPVPRDRSASLSSTSTAHNAVPTTLISFDVEATSEPADASGNYSAELRNANDAPTADNDPAMSKRVIYDVTAMSLLPAHLFADGVVVLIATACAVPLESVMVRCIARSWACKTGMSAARRAQMWDMWPRRHRWTAGLSRGVLANVVVGFLCDLCVTGVIWGGCLGTWAALDWWNREEEGKDGEGR